MNQKAELGMHLYLMKNNLRSNCLEKCLDFTKNTTTVNNEEETCLKNCSTKMKDFFRIAVDAYKNNNLNEN